MLKTFYGENADEKLCRGRIEKLKETFFKAEGAYPERIFSSPGEKGVEKTGKP